jgi:hypothetical protein
MHPGERGEFNLRRNLIESDGVSPIDEALRKIEDHIEDAELNSPRFQAFADGADVVYANLTIRYPSAEEHKGITRNMREMREVLIDEDIRKKKNTVVGYKQELDGAERLFEGLMNAVDATTKNAKGKDQQATMVSAIKRVVAIKEQAIDRKSQPSTPPQTQ